MSVIVKGMEMPKRCLDCPFMVSRDNDDCVLQTEVKNELARTWEELKASCPLIELPPQARLIDANAHIREIRKQYCEDCSRRKGIKNGKMQFCYEIGGVVCRACEIEDMLNALDDAHAVIEAEGETDGR